jgi:hypothetical protein
MVMDSQRSQMVLQLLPLLKDTFVDIKAAQFLLLLCQIHIHGTAVTLFTRIFKVTAARHFWSDF